MKYPYLFVAALAVLLVSGGAVAQEIFSENGASVSQLERTAPSLIGRSANNQISVTFLSNPSMANLFIDGVQRGNTPATLILSPGTHTARVTKSGYWPLEFNFTIREGYRYTYRITLAPMGGGGGGNSSNSTVHFTSSPSDAQLWVDGTRYGSTPETVSLRPGSHTAFFSKEGYRNLTARFSILGGRTYNLNVNLVPISGGGNQLTVDLRMAQWYPQGNNAVLICQASGGSGNYEYDFHFGDGMHQYGQSSNNVFHVYPSEGSYGASCTVRDKNSGASRSDSLTVVISEDGDDGPDDGNDTDTNDTEPGEVELNVADWYPQGLHVVWECESDDDEAAEYTYVFGDGQMQTTDRDDVYHVYPSAGTYNAECIVRDAEGQEIGRASESVSVSAS